MTTSILDTLALLPSGAQGQTLDLGELGAYLRRVAATDDVKERNVRHALRDELYRDGGVQYMKGVIDRVFIDPQVRELRKQWVEHTRFDNPLKRIVNELSTVYAEPAQRYVDGDANQATYVKLLDAVRMDEVMFQVGRLVNLHRSLLVGIRVKKRLDQTERVPVLDVATPTNVRAVMHPADQTEVVGWMIRTDFKPARVTNDIPSWVLWTEHERVHLRDDLSVIGGTYIEHGLGVCPWVPLTLGPPFAGFFQGEEGADLVSASVLTWLTHTLMAKETKSATKQSVIQGDMTNVARSQAADSEVPIEIGDGTAISSIDSSMDLGMFRSTVNHIIEHAAQNYGMSAALITHQGVQSAEARELMREPLRELRKQQQIPLRRFEERMAVAMAAVMKVDLPALAFNADGWRIEFADAKTKLMPQDELALFEKERAAGLDNTVAFLQRRNPGMTAVQAEAEVVSNIAVETWRNEAMRPLMAISGSMGAQTPNVSGGAAAVNNDDEGDEPSDSKEAPPALTGE